MPAKSTSTKKIANYLAFLTSVLAILAIVFYLRIQPGNIRAENRVAKKVWDSLLNTSLMDRHQYKGELMDVSHGTASGKVYTAYDQNTFNLYAEFTDLPEPDPGFFYEGWLVRKGETMNTVSTGRVSLDTQGKFANSFRSDTDLIDHDFYVLTLEPDDHDPSPADHVLEGKIDLEEKI